MERLIYKVLYCVLHCPAIVTVIHKIKDCDIILSRTSFLYVFSIHGSDLEQHPTTPVRLRIVFRDNFTPEVLYNMHVLWLQGDSVAVDSGYL